MFKFADPDEGELFSKVPFAIYWGTSALLSVIVGWAMWYFGPSQLRKENETQKQGGFFSFFKKEFWEINILTP